MRTLRFLAVIVAGLGLHTAAEAQFLSGSCVGGACANTNSGTFGPALFGANPSGKLFTRRPVGGCEPYCAVNSYPLSDWAYIRKFCGPQLIPGSCYGHYQTKWRKWEDHCPGGKASDGTCTPSAMPINAPYEQPIIMTPQPGTTLGEPRPVEVPKVDMPKLDQPRVMPMPVPVLPANPGKPPLPANSINTMVPSQMPVVSPSR